ncbi:hypothetical protein C4J81_17860 [Deltaproteobacteria bacterium Smac51]|nr:hypothetical protein C4J81_17860 [Deltaproteobacteria bacterium Smac51]
MSQIDGIGGPRTAAGTGAASEADSISAGRGAAASRPGSLPPAGGGAGSLASSAADLPTLAPPSGSLSLTSLYTLLNSQERETTTKSSRETIEVQADRQEEVNTKRMEQVQKNLGNLKSNDVLGGFVKAFQIIGMIFAVLGAVASIAVGAMTGNVLMVAGGAMSAVMMIDSAVKMGTDGDVALVGGLSSCIAKACGADEKVQEMIQNIASMLFGLATAVVNLGGGLKPGGHIKGTHEHGAMKTMKQIVDDMPGLDKKGKKEILNQFQANMMKAAMGGRGGKIMDVTTFTNKVMMWTQFITPLSSAATGVTGAVLDDEAADIEAVSKELEAELADIQATIDQETGHMEAIMQKYQDMTGKITQLIKDNLDTQQRILTGC